jgi:hypothetical protein
VRILFRCGADDVVRFVQDQDGVSLHELRLRHGGVPCGAVRFAAVGAHGSGGAQCLKDCCGGGRRKKDSSRESKKLRWLFVAVCTVRLTSIDHPQIEGAYLGIARCEFHFSVCVQSSRQ